MSFSRDALPTIIQRVRANMALRVKDPTGKAVDTQTPGTGYTELCDVMAGLMYEMQGRDLFIAQQILVRTMSDAQLIQRAVEEGVPRIAPAFATGTATVAGTNGVVIAEGKVLQHASGLRYRVLAEATISGGTATISIIAMQTGAASNLAAGQSLTFISPITGVDSDATVVMLAAGSDIEPIERLRTRVLQRMQQPPMGGKDYDYVEWARAAHVDVTRVFPFFHENGLGSVVVRFVTEDLATPIPTASHITAVADYLEIAKPAGTRNFAVEAPTAKPMNLVFTSLTPNTPEVQAAIDAELQDLIRREGTCDGTLLLTHIRQAISNAPGEEDYAITLAADFVTTASEFPTLGTTTWPGA